MGGRGLVAREGGALSNRRGSAMKWVEARRSENQPGTTCQWRLSEGLGQGGGHNQSGFFLNFRRQLFVGLSNPAFGFVLRKDTKARNFLCGGSAKSGSDLM